MKSIMQNLKHLILDHPKLAVFFALISTLIEFTVKSWSVNIILLVCLFLSIAINTISGVRLARKKGQFDLKVLKDKTAKKVLGYLIFIFALWVVIMAFFLSSLNDMKPLVSPYLLNIPMTTAFMFFMGVEFLSTKDNLIEVYGIKTPSAITDNLESFVKSGGKQPDTIINN